MFHGRVSFSFKDRRTLQANGRKSETTDCGVISQGRAKGAVKCRPSANHMST